MKLNQLTPAKGAHKVPFRRGRGIGSGWGKTAGRGSKGQLARSGGKVSPGFEGGQMPLAQKMPKRGFHNPFRVSYEILNLGDLARVGGATMIDPAVLHQHGLVRKDHRVKILSDGDAPQGVTVKAHKFSKRAVEKLAAAGGKTEVLA